MVLHRPIECTASIRHYALVAEIGTAILHVIDIAITTIHH